MSSESYVYKKGEVFTITLNVDAHDGYIFWANAYFYSDNLRDYFECRGYMPIDGDSEKVRAVQKGQMNITCNVPRRIEEGTYRMAFLDLSSVGCKIDYVMQIADVVGVKCPHSWTHYAFRSFGQVPVINWSAPYATENQNTSLGYPTETFSSFPTIEVRGYKNLETPKVEIIKIDATRITAQYFHGSDYDRDTLGLCSISSGNGNLNTYRDVKASLPLNGAAQPQFNITFRFEIDGLEPGTINKYSITCKGSDGQSVSTEYEFKTNLPARPSVLNTSVYELSQTSALIKITDTLIPDVKYTLFISNQTLELIQGELRLDKLSPNTNYYYILRATDKFGQNTSSTVRKFATLPNLTTLSCVKGKSIIQVKAVNPKCPAGYKKK